MDSKNKTQKAGIEVTDTGARMKLRIGQVEAEVVLSEDEIDGLLAVLTKAKETLRRATGKPGMTYGVITESGTGRPLSPAERQNCLVDIPLSEVAGVREGVLVHLKEHEHGTETSQP